MAGPRSVKSADRVLDILEAVGRKPNGATFMGLSAELRIPKSSLHALLELLRRRDYLEFDGGSRIYTIGVRAWETGFAYHRHNDIVDHAHHVLESIVEQVNETAQFAKLVGHENVYLTKVDSSHALRLQSEVGSRLSAHATGVGKALLAQLDESEVRRRFPGEELPVYTPNTISMVRDLLEEMRAIRVRGFAIDNEEYTLGVFCLAVPVFDRDNTASTAISVSVPQMRVTPDGLSRILAALAAGSLRISRSLGNKTPHPILEHLSDPVNAASGIAALEESNRYHSALTDRASAARPT